MTSKPFVRRTFATLRSAEFGFLGVVVYTRVHTPRRNGFDFSAGDFSFLLTSRRLRRTSWLIVGMEGRETSNGITPWLHFSGPGWSGENEEDRNRPCEGQVMGAL